MKKLILGLLLITVPLLAWETWLGMVDTAEGDYLILTDGAKVYVPNLSAGRYIGEDNNPLDPKAVVFPFTASLVVGDESKLIPEHKRAHSVFVKIHKFYRLDSRIGRLVEQ